jgi:signal transduction histidine kinase/CheY-like chemotaxis protein
MNGRPRANRSQASGLEPPTAGLTRLRRWTRGLGLIDIVAAGYVLVYVAWVVWHEPGTWASGVIGDAAFYPLGLAVAWFDVQNARAAARHGFDRRTQFAWWLLAASALVLWFSGTAWSYFVRLTGPISIPLWIDALEWLQLSLTIAAALSFPRRRSANPSARLRLWLDVALVLVSSFAVAVHYQPTVLVPETAVRWVDFVTVRTVLDWGVFFTLSIGVIQLRDRTGRVAVGALLSASMCVLSANWLLGSVSGYQAGNPVDLLWFCAWAFKGCGARYAWYRYRRLESEQADDSGEPRGAWLPRLVVAASIGILVYQAMANPQGAIAVFVYAATLLTTLLAVRQVVELRENDRRFEDLQTGDLRYRLLVERSFDLVLIVGANRRIIHASGRALREFGMDVVRTGIDIQSLLRPADLSAFEALVTGALGHSRRLACLIGSRNAAWREIEFLVDDLRDDPAVRGFVLSGRDVTVRHELERQLRSARRLDVVSQMAGGVAHDLNNALTTIRGAAELLIRGASTGPEQRKDLENIELAVDRAASITQKLLAFGRQERLERRPVDLGAILGGLAPILEQVVTKTARLEIARGAACWPVVADSSQIEEVLVNLTANARDALKPEGGRIRIGLANVTISDSAPGPAVAPHGDYVALTVADDGIGMAESVRARVFEPFFTTKARGAGTGLGLAMVYGIVSQSGGFLDLRSAVGLGTTVTVLLPRTASPQPPAAVVDDLAQPEPSASLVLVVDDEATVRAVVRRMLQSLGHAVAEASDSQEALTILDGHATEVNLLLTDLVMPGMSGIELASWFRQRHPSAPVVCMSGFEVAEQADEVSRLNAAFLAKPFSGDSLRRALAEARLKASGREGPHILRA